MHRVKADKTLALAGVDWQQAWEHEDSLRSKPADASHWSCRAKSYGERSLSVYEQEFIRRSGIQPGQTVLDFGCGVGLLAIPLAKMGCKVVACDFSQGMLDRLESNAQAAGVPTGSIETHLVAWDDDWQAAGILPDSVDVAIASRSIATRNLLGALTKLDRCARERVCVTVAAGRSPRRDERAFAAVGRSRPPVADFAFCANILFQHGVFPEVSYITTRSRAAFADRAEAVESLTDMLGGALSAEEAAELEAFLDAHYSIDPDAHPARAYAADVMRDVRWAFISW